jgi:hypothetical protein
MQADLFACHKGRVVSSNPNSNQQQPLLGSREELMPASWGCVMHLKARDRSRQEGKHVYIAVAVCHHVMLCTAQVLDC